MCRSDTHPATVSGHETCNHATRRHPSRLSLPTVQPMLVVTTSQVLGGCEPGPEF